MNYTTYGKTGKKVSILGMGGMRFDKDIPEKECEGFIRYANELGINYFDTAPLYNEDRSEGIYGRAFSAMPRENFLVATKGEQHLTAKQVEASIERSVKRLGVEYINFFFLWSIITPDGYKKAAMKGKALEGILRARERGLIEHIGVSTHMYSAGIKLLVDEGIFEFIMIPYNALNFAGREEGVRYAQEKNLGTAAMNPAYGGVIPQYKDLIEIFPGSQNSPVEDAFRFCLESPYIDVTLSGMNSRKMIQENAGYAASSEKISPEAQDKKQQKIEEGFTNMCTSCGYCLRHCPEEINIKAYMEIYNTYMLTQSENHTLERYKWYHKFGPLMDDAKRAGDCAQCHDCEPHCTQYLNIVERLAWIDEKFGDQKIAKPENL